MNCNPIRVRTKKMNRDQRKSKRKVSESNTCFDQRLDIKGASTLKHSLHARFMLERLLWLSREIALDVLKAIKSRQT